MANEDVLVTLRLRDALSQGARKARAEIDGISRSVRESGDHATRAASKHDSLDRTFSRLSNSGSRFFGVLKTGLVTLSAFAGAQGLAGLGVAKLAVDLVETQQKFDVVFGDQAGGLQKYVSDIHRQFGFFTGDLEDSLAMFGTLGRSIDLTGKPLADFSTNMQNVALDLKSQFNKPLKDVNEAIASALEGMPRPLRDMGIFVSETAIKARGALHGWTGELTDQQKVLLRSEEILDQFNKSAARGDLLRTAMSPANQLAQAEGRLKQIGAIVGGIALAPLGSLLPSLNRYLIATEDRLNHWTDTVKKRAEKLGPELGRNFRKGNLAGAASNIVDILGAPSDLKQPLEDIMVLFRDFGRIVKTDLIPAARDIGAVLIPVLDGIRRFFDLLPPGTVRALLETFLAWKAVSTVTKVLEGLKVALFGVAEGETAVAAAGGASVGGGAAGGAAGSGGLLGLIGGIPMLLPVADIIANAERTSQPNLPVPKKAKKRGFWSSLIPRFGHDLDENEKKANAKRYSTGDTSTPHRGGVIGSIGPYLQTGQYVTSGYRTWGIGNDSDHLHGAVDLAGPGLLGTMAMINRNNGYAAMHGAGAGRHLHAVPAGDTASPRRAMATVGGGDTNTVHLNFYGPAPADPQAVARQVERIVNEWDRKKQRRSPSG